LQKKVAGGLGLQLTWQAPFHLIADGAPDRFFGEKANRKKKNTNPIFPETGPVSITVIKAGRLLS
jgi:hypothetical protein